MGELFRLVAKFDVDDACFELEDTYDVVHNLVETPFEGHCDMYVHGESYSLCCEIVSPSPLDHSHVSLMCSPPSPSLGIILVSLWIIL